MGRWYVICTRKGWEKKVEQGLLTQGLECFCPQILVRRQWSDRVKLLPTPLFESHIFVKITDEHRQIVRMTHGVKNFVYAKGKPAILKKREVDALRQLLFGYRPVQLFRLAGTETNPEALWQTGETNGNPHPGQKVKKARIFIGEAGYEVWAVQQAPN